MHTLQREGNYPAPPPAPPLTLGGSNSSIRYTAYGKRTCSRKIRKDSKVFATNYHTAPSVPALFSQSCFVTANRSRITRTKRTDKNDIPYRLQSFSSFFFVSSSISSFSFSVPKASRNRGRQLHRTDLSSMIGVLRGAVSKQPRERGNVSEEKLQTFASHTQRENGTLLLMTLCERYVPL